MENKVIYNCHDNLGHLGINKTIGYLSRVYWFPDFKNKIKVYIQNCITYSFHSGKEEGTLHNIPKETNHLSLCISTIIDPYKKHLLAKNVYLK